jgi:multidrug efflux pump subunit AcrA (membrane-fusion protein)
MIRKKLTTYFIAGGFLLVAALGIGLTVKRYEETRQSAYAEAVSAPVPSVRAVTARKGPIQEWIIGEGIARTVRREFLNFGQSGKVVLIGQDTGGQPLREGSRVSGPQEGERFGQVLAQIDRRELIATVDVLKSELDQSRQNVLIAEASVFQAETEYALAQADLERVTRLSEAGTTISLYEEELAQARQAGEAGKAALAQAESDLKLAKAELERTRQLQQRGVQRKVYEEGVTQARQQVAAADSALAQARNEYALAEKNIAKAERLLKDGVLSQREYDQERTAFLNAQEAVNNADATVQTARSQENNAAHQLERATIELSVVELEAAQSRYRNAEAAVNTAKANLETMRSQVKAAQTRLEQAKIDVPVVEYETARAKLLTAEAAVKTTAAQLEAAQSQVEGAAARLRQAQVGLEQATLFAPFDGVITYLNVKIGDYASAMAMDKSTEQAMSESAHIVLIDPTHYEVTVKLPVYLGSVVTPGMAAVLHPEYGVDHFTGDQPPDQEKLETFGLVDGTVYSVSPSISPGERSILVRIRTGSGSELLQDGMLIACYITVQEAPDAVLIPLNSILYRENNAHVFVVDPDTGAVTRRQIVDGLANTREAQVVAGIEEGELVVTDGRHRLVDGMQVAVISEEGGPAL